MANGISAGLIETVQRHIYDALAQTSERSTLPGNEQDRLLAQACAEACDVLTSWLASPEWAALCPVRPGPDRGRHPGLGAGQAVPGPASSRR